MKKQYIFLATALASILVLAACASPITRAEGSTGGPYRITGSFDYTAVDYVLETRWVEHAVALVDMNGFIIRDMEWEIPVDSQYLGFLDVDTEANTAAYELYLPVHPQATFVDVDNDDKEDAGVQVFAVAWWSNTYGGIYAEGDDRSTGWAAFLASVKTDEENDYEVTGGKLVVWTEDDGQDFPSGFGDDQLLFTEDDPVASLPAGWTVVDLDQSPFSFTQEAEPDLELYQPLYVAEKDYSALSYSEAFEQMFAFIRQDYAFNDIEGKQPDWDALYAELQPRVTQAEQDGDAEAFSMAIRDFSRAFHDGHVYVGNEILDQAFQEDVASGYGFAIRQLDDGKYTVIYVSRNGPAEEAGIELGAEITQFNGEPVEEAIANVQPWSIMSMELHNRYQQERYLLRAAPGTQATVTYLNPGTQQAATATLTAISEVDSFQYSSIYRDEPVNIFLPVEFTVLDSGVGYVAIRSNEDDVNLIIKLFERSLKTFESLGVPGVIIDMRFNSGGLPLGLATFLTDQDIPMGQSYYFSEVTGQFEPEGPPEVWEPMSVQYTFDKMALLVGPGCASACEEEAYGFSQVPGMVVVGMYPTLGAYGEVSRGQIVMPEGIYMQVPTGRYVLPDGSLLLEGTGVQPTLQVPVTLETVTSTSDVVLEYAERAVLLPLGAGIIPSSSPTILGEDETMDALNDPVFFEDLARETYTQEEYLELDRSFPFTITLSTSETLLWTYGWCAKDQTTLDENLNKMEITFTLDNEDIPLDQILGLPYEAEGQTCYAYVMALDDWAGGEHHASTRVEYTTKINDGQSNIGPGFQTFDYAVYVNP